MTEIFLSCDWGTSNFRLRLVKSECLEILSEVSSSMGVKNFSSANHLERREALLSYLSEQVTKLSPENITPPVVISGMASSSVGIEELPYVRIPSGLPQLAEGTKTLKLKEGNLVYLISGLQTESSIMRGEEVQALGLIEEKNFTNGILILPGTHSKHLELKDGQISSFKTFMTGEIFETLAFKTLLASSVSQNDLNAHTSEAFLKGVKMSSNYPLSELLFTVRVNDVLNKTNKQDNFHYLSGLLIGDEISYLKNSQRAIALAANEPLFSAYSKALNSLKINFEAWNQDVLDKAILSSHNKILSHYA